MDSGNLAWSVTATALVLFMTPGVAFFYGGLVKAKSVVSMMMMSFGALGLVSVLWILYGFNMSAVGSTWEFAGNPFSDFGLGSAGSDTLVGATFGATFAIITVALITGAIADRAKFGAWMIFAVLWVTVVYFPVAHGSGVAAGSWPPTFGSTERHRLRRWHRRTHQRRCCGARACARPRQAHRIPERASIRRTTFRSSCSARRSCGSAGSASTPAPRAPSASADDSTGDLIIVNTRGRDRSGHHRLADRREDQGQGHHGLALHPVRSPVSSRSRRPAPTSARSALLLGLAAGVISALAVEPEVPAGLRRLARRRRHPPRRWCCRNCLPRLLRDRDRPVPRWWGRAADPAGRRRARCDDLLVRRRLHHRLRNREDDRLPRQERG